MSYSRTRTTHTYALLQISRAAYNEIAQKLRDANYHHAFSKDDDGAIDMAGLALIPQEPEQLRIDFGVEPTPREKYNTWYNKNKLSAVDPGECWVCGHSPEMYPCNLCKADAPETPERDEIYPVPSGAGAGAGAVEIPVEEFINQFGPAPQDAPAYPEPQKVLK